MPLLETSISPLLVGRTREVELLDQALRAARNGVGRCVLLAGEAGIGKTRLVAEIRSRAVDQHWIILQGHCAEQDVSFPYAPWIDALRAFFAPKSAAEASELLGAYGSELVKVLPELSLLVLSLQPTPPLDPEAEKHRLFESFARLVASLVTTNPLMVVLEDIHWSDEQSLELFHFFVRRIATLPILMIATYRSEESSPRVTQHLVGLVRERLVQEIRLAPLAPQDVDQMVRAILKSEHVSAANWLDVLMPLTEGNPFFVEEMLKSLVEAGTSPSGPSPLQIPRSIEHMVQRRAEQLTETTRRILALAAVIGERFDFGLVQEIAGQDEPSLLQMLKELIAAQLIVEETADQFAFRHALTREAIYASLLLRERQALHKKTGETMERLWGTTGDLHAAELAYHFDRAAVWDKALEYSQRAGEQADRLHAPREALAHFSRALKAAEQLKTTPASSIPSGRAHALELLGEFDFARIDYERALELARGAEDRKGEWTTLIDLGFLWQSRDWVRAGEYFERALDLAHSLEETALVARSLNRIGNWHTNRGHPREALTSHQQALELFRALNDRHGMAQTLDLLGFDSYVLGDVVQGAAYGEQAVPILRELDDRQGLVNALTNLSMRSRFDTEVLGEVDLHRLANLSETAVEIARSCDYRKGEGDALMKTAVCLCRAGEYGRGLECLYRASSIAEEIEHRELATTVRLAWGIELDLGLLAFAEAREYLEAGLAAAQEIGSVALTSIATARLATACILQKDWARAQELLGAVLHADLPDVSDMTFLLRGLWTARVELELVVGNSGRALEIVERLLASTLNLARYGPYTVPRLSQLRGQALAALGRNEEAVAEFQGAQTVAQKQGQRPMLWRLQADLGKAYRAMGRREDAQDQFSSARTIIQDLANTLPEGALRDNFLKQAFAAIPAAPALTPRRAAMKEFSGLTEREREIAALIAQGKSNRSIAEELSLSERTVDRHVSSILSKLNFHSRTQVARWAVERGLGK